MRFLRRVAGYTLLDRRRSGKIRRKHEVHSNCKRIEVYRTDWRDHMFRMADSSSAKTVWNYRPRGHNAVGLETEEETSKMVLVLVVDDDDDDDDDLVF
jgi:hypothetical protein